MWLPGGPKSHGALPRRVPVLTTAMPSARARGVWGEGSVGESLDPGPSWGREKTLARVRKACSCVPIGPG